jgi:hypothetical protein
MADRPARDLALELIPRQPGADLLLERQPSVPRILHAIHRHGLDALAGNGQHDGQSIHHEARIDPGREHGNLRTPRHRVDLFCE